MNCPKCSNLMIVATASSFGEEYQYCRVCKKELSELVNGRPGIEQDAIYKCMFGSLIPHVTGTRSLSFVLRSVRTTIGQSAIFYQPTFTTPLKDYFNGCAGNPGVVGWIPPLLLPDDNFLGVNRFNIQGELAGVRIACSPSNMHAYVINTLSTIYQNTGLDPNFIFYNPKMCASMPSFTLMSSLRYIHYIAYDKVPIDSIYVLNTHTWSYDVTNNQLECNYPGANGVVVIL